MRFRNLFLMLLLGLGCVRSPMEPRDLFPKVNPDPGLGPVTRLRHSGFYYAPKYDLSDWFARAYEEAVAPQSIDQLLADNPQLKVFTYKSGTDTYRWTAAGTPMADGLRYAELATEMGVFPEAMYCHWADSTAIEWWGGVVTQYPAGAPVEVYHDGHQNAGLRYLHSFTPATRPVHLRFHTELMAKPSAGGHLYAGLFMDNSGSSVFNWGVRILTGGTVAEANAKMGSAAFNTWHWQNYRDYLVELRSALNARGQLLGINVANGWSEDFLDYAVADRLFREFCGNPIRDHFPNAMEMFRRQKKAAQYGVGIVNSASPDTQGVSNGPGVRWDVMQYGVLCYQLALGSSTTLFHIQDWTGPQVADWPQRVVSPAEAVELGAPLEDPWVMVSGVSPGGNAYQLVRRAYTHGFVLLRIRAPWNAYVTDAIQVHRNRGYLYVTPAGAKSDQAVVSIPNGGGAIFVRDTFPEPAQPPLERVKN